MIRKAIILSLFVLSMFLPAQFIHAQDVVSVANDDFFSIREDSLLSVGAPGLFFNDEQSNDSLLVFMVTPPANGSVTVNQDGSFDYTPNAGFDGVDSFTYLIQTLPMQVLTVDTTQSTLNFDMEVSIILGTATDAADARIGGEAAFFLHPDTAPFTEAQLYNMHLVVLDSLALEFKFGVLITLGRLFVDAEAGAFNLDLSKRGDPAEVIDGMFTQDSSKVNVIGTVSLRGTGFIAGEVPEEPQAFDTETDAGLALKLVQEDTTLTLEVPVSLEEAFQLSGTDINLKVLGQLLATGPLKQPVQSNIATVSITVDPISRTDVDRELPFSYALSQNYPNPFNPVTTIAFSVPTSEVVTLKVFDMLGREVSTLIDGVQSPGIHEIQFDAGALPSGMYVYRLEAKGFSDVKKLILLK